MERRTETGTPQVVVTGDVSLDIFVAPPSVFAELHSVDLHASVRTSTNDLVAECRFAIRRGGSLLLADFIQYLTDEYVFAHSLDNFHDTSIAAGIPQTIVQLCRFPRSALASLSSSSTVRVREQLHLAPWVDDVSTWKRPYNFPRNPDVVIICDEGKAYRQSPELWLDRSERGERLPSVILLSRMPLGATALWDFVASVDRSCGIAIVLADDLRAQGAPISRGLSWERTALELRDYFSGSKPQMAPFENLIVLLGLEGALLLRPEASGMDASLFYCPSVAEGGTAERYPGQMLGLTFAFVASLTAQILKCGRTGIEQGIRDGLRCAARLQRRGFGDTDGVPDYPTQAVFTPDVNPDDEATYLVPIPPVILSNSDLIIRSKSRDYLLEVATGIVVEGPRNALLDIPVVRFGRCISIDRREYEQLRSVQNLVTQHLARRKARPLSLAIFAPPGSGKTFAIKEVVKTAAAGPIVSLEFSVSQFLTADDLSNAFHAARDATLSGDLPILFFDDFDCDFEGRVLGWLKHFLLPMQNGMFHDGSRIRPVGSPIIVFLSGQHGSISEFERSYGEESDRYRFIQAKGPDFVSRLQGFIQLLGVNPSSEEPDNRTFLLRRALTLRALLESRWPKLFDTQRQANIDSALLRALLTIGYYKHGTRSMAQLLDSSLSDDAIRFLPSMLPSRDSLRLYVDPTEFSDLLTIGINS